MNKLFLWIDKRLPLLSFIKKEFLDSPTPKNLNFLWSFGFLLAITLFIMIMTGLFLAIHYIPDTSKAFSCIQFIMNEVPYGWLIRYLHINGATFFFVLIYLHMLRSMYYGSYKNPRELLWIIGVIIFILTIITAFMGYVLPFGQMSFWGATVIINLLSALPFGETITNWLLGGNTISSLTLQRFFVLHIFFPFLIIFFSILHIAALHKCGSNNPSGKELMNKDDYVTFHPHYTLKYLFFLGLFLITYLGFVFFLPEFFSNPLNNFKADPLKTPSNITPEWYFLPFYAILRSIQNKFLGSLAFFSSILILFFLPWLDKHPIKSGKYRPYFKVFFMIFVLNGILLGWVGSNPISEKNIFIGKMMTLYYFSYFLIILPLLSRYEKINISDKEYN